MNKPCQWLKYFQPTTLWKTNMLLCAMMNSSNMMKVNIKQKQCHFQNNLYLKIIKKNRLYKQYVERTVQIFLVAGVLLMPYPRLFNTWITTSRNTRMTLLELRNMKRIRMSSTTRLSKVSVIPFQLKDFKRNYWLVLITKKRPLSYGR